MKNRGDRLVFSSGIVVLALASSFLVIIFRADEIAMLPLYALGVMLGFTLSQAGMFRLMGKIAKLKPGETAKTAVTEIHAEKYTRAKQVLNGVGAVVTFIVLIILTLTKFKEGAWVVVLAIPVLVTFFYLINRHYDQVASTLSTRELKLEHLSDVANTVFVPIADLHRGSMMAIQYAKRISNDVRVLTIITSQEEEDRFMRRWNRFPEL
ncbi:MAG: permease, partial [Anaerolineales bacterium]